MRRLNLNDLTEAILDALTESGATAVVTSPAQQRPKRFVIQLGQNVLELWVYAWTLTHGGGAARPRNEYRIQLTAVTPPLALNPAGPTILIGYEPRLQCFAGFDISKHTMFSTNSPSIQIPITALERALQDGFSFVTKGNDEIAIGFRADQLLAYALNADLLHAQGADAKMVELLTKAAALEPIASTDLQQVPQERQRVVSTISRLFRDADFRRKVTVAYDRRCAVTRIQLRLIDAAHILPVGAEGSTDEVSNGLCLSPTYHRAYDRSLIYLDENLTMQINPEQEAELIRLGLDGGLNDFKAYLGKRIHLPADRNQWPNTGLIRKANEFRGIG